MTKPTFEEAVAALEGLLLKFFSMCRLADGRWQLQIGEKVDMGDGTERYRALPYFWADTPIDALLGALETAGYGWQE